MHQYLLNKSHLQQAGVSQIYMHYTYCHYELEPKLSRSRILVQGSVHKRPPTIMGYFGRTYLLTHVRCFLYYDFYLSPIFAEITTYPKIRRPFYGLHINGIFCVKQIGLGGVGKHIKKILKFHCYILISTHSAPTHFQTFRRL